MSFDIPDIPNWVTLLIELPFGVVIGYWLYRLQKKTDTLRDDVLNEIRTTTKRTDSVTQQKAVAEQSKKEFECLRIIGHLQGIQVVYEKLKEAVTNHKLGDPKNELLKFYVSQTFHPISNYIIDEMKDAVENNLNDSSLRTEFLYFLGMFTALPELILEQNRPRNENDRTSLLILIDKQVAEIQKFDTRFCKELESVDSVTE